MNSQSFFLTQTMQYIVTIHESKWVKVALHPSNAKKLYMDEKSTEKREVR